MKQRKIEKIKCINPRNHGNYVDCTFCCDCFDPLSLKRDKHYEAGIRVIDALEITEETVLEKDGLSDYESYGTSIVEYDISDKSAIEELCPKELLENKPYVDGYVETYSLSGHDGSNIRLYLDGDFSSVSVQIQNQEYTSEVDFYAREDFDLFFVW